MSIKHARKSIKHGISYESLVIEKSILYLMTMNLLQVIGNPVIDPLYYSCFCKHIFLTPVHVHIYVLSSCLPFPVWPRAMDRIDGCWCYILDELTHTLWGEIMTKQKFVDPSSTKPLYGTTHSSFETYRPKYTVFPRINSQGIINSKWGTDPENNWGNDIFETLQQSKKKGKCILNEYDLGRRTKYTCPKVSPRVGSNIWSQEYGQAI